MLLLLLLLLLLVVPSNPLMLLLLRRQITGVSSAPWSFSLLCGHGIQSPSLLLFSILIPEVFRFFVVCAAEEYCTSSKAFASWRRFGPSPRSWELYLLLTRAVLIRRRKTLRPLSPMATRGPSQGASEGPSQGPSQGPSTPYDEDQDHGEAAVAGAPRGAPKDGHGSSVLLEEMKDMQQQAGLGLHAVASATQMQQERGDASSFSSPEGLLLGPLKDAAGAVEGLPWADEASGCCEALVLPPCTRIAQLLLLQCNNQLLMAMAKGLLLQRPDYHSLLQGAQDSPAAVEGRIESSGSSDEALAGRERPLLLLPMRYALAADPIPTGGRTFFHWGLCLRSIIATHMSVR